MDRRIKRLALVTPLALIPIGVGLLAFARPDARLDAEVIGRAAQTKATTTPDGIVRITWARTDVPVTVDGLPLKPFAGLGSWAAFAPATHGAMVMGDTVVFQDEVTPAMDAAVAHGLEVTGLHNHFFFDEPKVYFMHVGDFIMTAEEVQPVLRALRQAGIHVVALHNHMVGEQPAFYFTHFWGKGPARELALGVKAAQDAQETARAHPRAR